MAASENKRDKRFFTGSTWWPIATGCLTWYAQHRDRVAEPDGFDDLFIGEGWFGIFAGMVDLIWPFFTGFLLALLVRSVFRRVTGNASSKKKSSDNPPPQSVEAQEDPSNPVDNDPEVIALKAKLAEVEAATKKTEVQQRISQLEQELKDAETKLNELKNDDQGS